MCAVSALVRVTAGDEKYLLTIRFQDLPQRFSDAAAVSKDKPAAGTRWHRVRLFSCDALFGLPLELIQPVVEIFLETAVGTVAQRFEVYSQYLDDHLSGVIQQPYFSDDAIGALVEDARFAPQM